MFFIYSCSVNQSIKGVCPVKDKSKQGGVFLHNCANVIWSFKGWKGSSLSILIFFNNFFSYIAKNASILHFKLDHNKWPSYFLTSTPSEHTPITTTVDLTYYKWLIVEMKRFWHLVCPNLTTFKFSLLKLYLCTFSEWTSDAFINKVLQGFDEVILLNTWIHVIFLLLDVFWMSSCSSTSRYQSFFNMNYRVLSGGHRCSLVPSARYKLVWSVWAGSTLLITFMA